jgi:hypothetical protein
LKKPEKSTSECVHAFVAGESKVFLYEVEDIGSPEPEVMLNLTTAHNGKVTRLNKKIGGVRKWKEKNLEKHNRKKIKNLAPKWQKRSKKLLNKIEKKRLKRNGMKRRKITN